MKSMKYLAGLVGVMALFASAQASATLINFENAHSAKGLNDNDSVTSQWAAEGVTFGGAFLEGTFDSGNPDVNPQGFLNDQTGNWDQGFSASPGLGDWFLRTGGEVDSRGGQGVYLTVDYTAPVFAASGQIWDIDGTASGTEQWRVVASLNGVQVAFEDSPLGNSKGAGSLDGLPWTFNLASGGGFDKIEFIFTGSKASGLGLAFDNFNTNSLTGVPEPAALGMFGLGALLIGLFAGLRRRIG
ncbi:MAG: PEP-CTERM sorting domain-containing protein [Rhodanobacteraceae bacterium]